MNPTNSELADELEADRGANRELDARIAVALYSDNGHADQRDNTHARLPHKSDECAPGTYWISAFSGLSLRTAPDYTSDPTLKRLALTALRTRKSEALADDAVERAWWPQIVAEALDCFWNAAIGSARDSQDPTALAISGSLAEGFAAIATRLREAPATALSTLTPSPAVDLLRDIREAATLAREALDDSDETEVHALLSNVQERIDAALKEANDG